ncbi:imidazolonepropionase-like amidohydrolase [Catalinimonas alkaloidigena]|uniref:amidohydrolase family protein n=1 Tax=Catalinimonas alkaloidigena TaxID=1075417 RepID=UPI002404C193|nr:amidohydrolase family protein [Catalinimonas alkaloidigena]MDF9797727.1 imidazolonepropionase-like amidohydrolase [Catalinimonas alkaloidigena]
MRTFCNLPEHSFVFLLIFSSLFFLNACSNSPKQSQKVYTVFVGAKLLDGKGGPSISDGVLLISEGRIEAVGSRSDVEIPEHAKVIDLSGKIVIPGLINSHAHVGYEGSMQAKDYAEDNIVDQLKLYASYGITTVISLGEDHPAAVSLRDEVDTISSPGRARLYIAGAVVTGDTPQEAIRMVDNNVKMGVDFIKIRVDDNLGSSKKMPEDVYQTVINRSHDYNLMLAAHMYYLEDAKSLVGAGADFLAHSVRDQEVDATLINLLKAEEVCYCPTLTRDLSTYVYEGVPAFFNDPFFLQSVDSLEIAALTAPERQEQVRENPDNETYKEALQMAKRNLKILSDSGVTIAMGTDSGVPTRFQGYFEHLEMNMMAEAGMQPMEILLSATRNPAQCLGLEDVGTLEPGHWADFVVLNQDPLEDIRHLRSIASVWIGGEEVER